MLMASRNHKFAPLEFYHCFNRGVEKRDIFMDRNDYYYFLKSLKSYNTYLSQGSLLRYTAPKDPLVSIVSYNLLPNHYHLVLQELKDSGISTLMKRLATGYTMYFNQKYNRSGGLFQGAFKSRHIVSDQDLLQVISYVDFNHIIHNLQTPDKFMSCLSDPEVSRGRTSTPTKRFSLEVVDIIKKQRLDLE